MDQLEPVRETVLQVFEVLQEHDAEGGAVDVDQDGAAVRLDLQGGTEDRQHGGDARAGRDGAVPFALPGLQGGGETPGRRHDVQDVAGAESFGRIGGEDAVGDALDADPQPARGGGGTDRVVAPHVVAGHRRL